MLATLRIGARRISHAFLASVLFCALSPEGPEARETGQQFVDWVWGGISSVHASWWCGVRLVVAGAKVLAVAVLGWLAQVQQYRYPEVWHPNRDASFQDYSYCGSCWFSVVKGEGVVCCFCVLGAVGWPRLTCVRT